MKILHIIYDDVQNPWCGGGGALRAKQINEKLALEHELLVLTGNFPTARNETINGVDYVRIGFGSNYILSRITFMMLIPFYLSRFKSELIVNDVSYFAPCFADCYTNRPVVNVIHHLMGKHAFSLYPLFGFFPFAVEKIFLKTCKHIITPSKSIKQILEKKKPRAKIAAIPNAVSEELFQLEPNERGFILFLGRIDVYMKGLDILLEAFSLVKNKNIILKIAGSGKIGDIKKVRKMINNLGLNERIELLGRVSEKEKLELLRSCLFLVMPSRFEGWGITAIEANAAGKPVLGTRIQGLSEAVKDGKTALLVKPEVREELTSFIDLLIENGELRNRLAKQGRYRAKKFSWAALAGKQLAFYKFISMG